MEQPDERRGDLAISTDPSRLDRALIRSFLAASYWAPGIPQNVVDRSIENSLCFGVYDGPAQVGFARVITDFATYAYVADVFVLEAQRGRGVGLWLMRTIRAHPRLQGLRRWSLKTRDAHGLYRQVGFVVDEHPERTMEILDRDVYRRSPASGNPSPPPLSRGERGEET